MVTAATRRREAGQHPTSTVPLVLAGAVVLLLAGAYASLRAGHWLAGNSAAVPRNPILAAQQLVQGTLSWPASSTVLLVSLW